MVPTGEDDVFSSTEGDSSPEGSGNLLSMPLHAAAVNGEKAVLRRLLQKARNIENIVDSQDHDGRTPLVYSILGDRQDCAGLLLKARANVNAADGYGMTALHYAANQGNHKCSKLLLSKGADCNARNNEGRTPLHFAAVHKSHKCLGLLLKRIPKGEADQGDDDCITPLHCATASGTLEHVKQLLKAGASPRRTDFEKKTALHWAARNEQAGVMRLLLEHDSEVINWQDVEGRAAVHLAAAHQNSAVVKALLSTGKCSISLMDNIGRSPLHWAAVLGNSQIVSQLLVNKADYKAADENGATALHYAAQSNFAETVEVMLSFNNMGDLRDNEGRTALVWAAGKGADKALETMLSHQLDVEVAEKSGGTALHSAAYSGHVSCVKLLLQFGACVNAADAINQTPLFRACERGHAEVVTILLENKAKITLDKDRRSPLHWAARGGHTLVCEILIKYGVSLDGRDRSSVTPLHCAAYSRSLNCMLLLIKHKADVNAQDVNGNSALHWSCQWGHLEAVKLLVGECNAFVNFKGADSDRLTPLNYAILGDHQDVAKYMIEKGGLTITNIEELAAECIQNQWRCYQFRKSFQNRKSLLKRHEQLKGIKKRSNAREERKKQAGSLLDCGDPPAVHRDFPRVGSEGSLHGHFTGGSECENELSPSGLEWEQRLSESRPGHHGSGNDQAATVSTASRVNSSEGSCDGDVSSGQAAGSHHGTPSALLSETSLTPVEEFQDHNSLAELGGTNTRSPYPNIRDCSEDDCLEGTPLEKEHDFKDDGVFSQRQSRKGRTASSMSPQSDFSNAGDALQVTPLAGREVCEKLRVKSCKKSALVHENYARTHNDSLTSEDFERRQRNSTNTHEGSVENVTTANKSERARKERERLRLFRATIDAAVLIQRSFRRYLKTKREFHGHKPAPSSMHEESEELTREVAALTIQLAWRKHRRTYISEIKSKEKAVYKDDRRASVASLPLSDRRLYASSQDVGRSPKFGFLRTRKVAPSRVAPSAACVSYNVAIGLYRPLVSRQGDKRAASAAKVRPRSIKRTASGWTRQAHHGNELRQKNSRREEMKWRKF